MNNLMRGGNMGGMRGGRGGMNNMMGMGGGMGMGMGMGNMGMNPMMAGMGMGGELSLCRSLILTFEPTTDVGIWDLQQDSKAIPSIPRCSIRAAAPTLEEVTGTSTEPSDRDRSEILRCVTCHSLAGSDPGRSGLLGTLIAVGSCPGV